MRLEGSAFDQTNNLLRQRPFRWWIGLVLLAAAVWIGWFLKAPLSLVASSQSAAFSSADTVSASFPPDVAMTLLPNQLVTIRLDQFPWREFGSGTGSIVRIDNQIRNNQVEVEIRYQYGLEGVPLQRDLTAQIIVVTEEVTPAELLWRRLVTSADR